MIRLPRCAVVLLCVAGCLAQRLPVSAQVSGSKIWVGRHQEFEEYLRTAECVRMEPLANTIITRCTLRAGGPAARMAWRSLPPGHYRGFRESIKFEIAAYELDKLLSMDMVPPTVSRQFQGTDGVAQLWVENVVDGANKIWPKERAPAGVEDQLVRMIMFDNLIGNKERNRANMLLDEAGNLFLIDHSRAFRTGAELLHKMIRIDESYWAKIESLTRDQLDARLREWLDADQIRAILDRRERMRQEIKSLPKYYRA